MPVGNGKNGAGAWLVRVTGKDDEFGQRVVVANADKGSVILAGKPDNTKM